MPSRDGDTRTLAGWRLGRLERPGGRVSQIRFPGQDFRGGRPGRREEWLTVGATRRAGRLLVGVRAGRAR